MPRLGWKILGNDQWQKEHEEERKIGGPVRGEGASIPGPRVTGGKYVMNRVATAGSTAAAAAAAASVTPLPVATLSIEEVKNALAANAAYFDQFLAAELQRQPGPRKGALAFLREFEARADTPRDGVIARIDAALGGGGSPAADESATPVG